MFMFLSRQSQKRCPPSNAALQDGTRSWEKYGKHQKLWAKKAREGWDASESACKEPASREAERNRAIRSMRHHAGAAVSCQNRQKWWQCDIKKCLLQIHSLLRLGHFKSIWNLWIQFFWSLDSWWYKQQEMLQRLDFRNRQTSKWRMTRALQWRLTESSAIRSGQVVWCGQSRLMWWHMTTAWCILPVWLGIFWFCGFCWHTRVIPNPVRSEMLEVCLWM